MRNYSDTGSYSQATKSSNSGSTLSTKVSSSHICRRSDFWSRRVSSLASPRVVSSNRSHCGEFQPFQTSTFPESWKLPVEARSELLAAFGLSNTLPGDRRPAINPPAIPLDLVVASEYLCQRLGSKCYCTSVSYGEGPISAVQHTIATLFGWKRNIFEETHYTYRNMQGRVGI